jgi:hypothetical protein
MDRPESGAGGLHQAIEIVRPRRIRGHGERLAAGGIDLARDAIQPVLRAGGDHHLGAEFGIRLGNVFSDAGADAGEDGGAAVQAEAIQNAHVRLCAVVGGL